MTDERNREHRGSVNPMNTSTTAQCGSEIVGEIKEPDLDTLSAWVEKLGADLRDRATVSVRAACARFEDCRDSRPLVHTMRTDDPLTVGDLRAMSSLIDDFAKVQSELAAARKALEDIVDPIGALRQYAESQGRQLDGYMAVILSRDPHHLQSIAREALAALSSKEPEGER